MHYRQRWTTRTWWIGLASLMLAASLTAAAPAGDLEQAFRQPPASARPWVYWFWLNGNITREGITADLEAMQRVGIGGVLIMEVDQGAPAGPGRLRRPEVARAVQARLPEADRLGLEVNMNNDAGWCGSGGPWITPELSMQKVVWTETERRRARKQFDGPAGRSRKAVGGLLSRHRRVGLPHARRATSASRTSRARRRLVPQDIPARSQRPAAARPMRPIPPRADRRLDGQAGRRRPARLGTSRGQVDGVAARPYADRRGQSSGARRRAAAWSATSSAARPSRPISRA